jgi:hypothetical protein
MRPDKEPRSRKWVVRYRPGQVVLQAVLADGVDASGQRPYRNANPIVGGGHSSFEVGRFRIQGDQLKA